MACACGANKKAADTFVVRKPDGSTISYSSEVEAAAAAQRTGGTYRKA